jgi:hypothetical protein
MHHSSELKELSDDQLEMAVGGQHSSRYSGNHNHGQQNSKTYIVNNYYIINSTDIQISNGSSKNSSNNGTWVSLSS